MVPVSDGTCKIPPEYFPNSDWSAHRALLGPDGMITAQLGASSCGWQEAPEHRRS